MVPTSLVILYLLLVRVKSNFNGKFLAVEYNLLRSTCKAH